MNIGGNMSKSESEEYSKFMSDISGVQAPYLQDLWGQAQDWLSENSDDWNQRLSAMEPGINEAGTQGWEATTNNLVGSQNAYQNQLGGGVYENAYGKTGIADVLGESLMGSLANPSAMQDINSMIMGGSGNNYADAMKSQYINDANSAQQNMLANMDARAAASGMSGGSRHGVLQGMGMENINSNLQRNLAETGFNTFDKDLDRKLNIAQQADQGTLARQGMMQNMLGQQNASQQGALNNLGMMNQQANAGMQSNNMYNQNMLGNFLQSQQPIQWLSGIIGGPQMASTGQSQGSSSGFSMGGSGGIT